MDIEFSGTKIQKLCSVEKLGVKTLGPTCAKKLRARMADLQAATSLDDLRGVPGTGRLHELTGDRKGQLAMDLLHPYRLILVATENPAPTRDDGGLDWLRITAVTIIEIVDYH